jgi:transcription-repair coupling factor (superfamily II helicase)
MLGAEQSGFINEIGYETYQKILEEAIFELKETEFADLYADEIKTESKFVRDCIIDTDFELLFPDSYIENLTERLILYKELDDIKEEEDLQKFRINLIDRFGKLPDASEELINLIRLKWLAEKLGFEKLIMKNNRFIGYLVANQNSGYYQTEWFTRILKRVQKDRNFKIKENNNKPSVLIDNIKSVNQLLNIFTELAE